ncbi:MAG: hypothetical protein KGL39_58545 [Patescibacteria group bacterium]|nr:hypothetical protein [Patescibacteria group bacterium]
MKGLDKKKFALDRIPSDVAYLIMRQPGKWLQWGYQRIRFIEGEAEIQALVVGMTANPFMLR